MQEGYFGLQCDSIAHKKESMAKRKRLMEKLERLDVRANYPFQERVEFEITH